MSATGIGASVPRREDLRLLTGQGRYSDNRNAPGQAYAAFVRSPHAHADIDSIDAGAARKMPGVVGVFTAKDLLADGLNPVPTLLAERSGGITNRDGTPFAEPPWFALAADRVRYVGEAVAIVIAETPFAAQDAAEAVIVNYTTRGATVDMLTADAPGAPQLHDCAPRNHCYDWECGDGQATARAIERATHVARMRLVDNRLIICFMEPRSAIGMWDASANRYTLFAGLHSIHQHAGNLARVFGIPLDRIRCVTDDVGGGFGARNQLYPEYIAITWAAKRLGRPVKWTSTRSEAFLTDSQSRDHVLDGELALDATGRITALRVHSTTNLGAHFAPTIPYSTVSNMERMISSLYAIPAIHLHIEGRFTNTAPVNVFRGIGRFECVYTVERLIEQAAKDTARDPIALRRMNMVPANAFPYRTATGALYDSGDFVARLDEAVKIADVEGFQARHAASARNGKLRGMGFGPYLEGTGGSPEEFAEVRVYPDGHIDVPVGSQSQGQSHETVFAQVVAERLGVPFETVRIVTGDTDKVAKGVGTFASRSMVRAGAAAAEVSDLVIALGTQMAAHLMETSVSDIEYKNGAFQVSGTDRRVGLFEVARAAVGGEIPPSLGRLLMASKMHSNPAFAFANGCEVCEVEVDPDTGHVQIVSLSVVDDSGRAVNPMVVHGQMHGAVANGIGQALYEHTVYQPETGQLLSGSFMDYTIPRADDLPSFPVISRDVASPSNILGVKGAGEGGTVGAPAAVIHAILDALKPYGVKHIEMPATPEVVWRAIAGRKA